MRGLNAPPRSREGPGGLHPLGAVGDLLLALDAAGACNDGKVSAADLHAVHINDTVVRVELAVGFFVRLGHAAAGLHHGVRQYPALGNGLGVADEAENMGVAALGVVDLQAHALQLAAELMHLYVGGICFNTMIIAFSPYHFPKRQGRPAPLLRIIIVNFSFVKYLEHGHSIPLQFCEVKAFLKFFRKRGRMGAR